MMRIEPVGVEHLRVIMCLTFDHRAPADEVMEFKRCIVACPYVLQSIQLTGTFDFMVEASFTDILEYQEKLNTLAERVARLVARYEANFVCKKFVRENDQDRAIWVPCQQGQLRVDCARIDMVQAEGDYMRVHSGAQTWLVHSTLSNLLPKLTPGEFVRIHRSLVLRCTYIERMLHEGRHWIARLQNGERKNGAKGHVREVLRALGIDPAKARVVSTAARALNKVSREPEQSGKTRSTAFSVASSKAVSINEKLATGN